MWDNTEHPADRDEAEASQDEYSAPMTRLDKLLLSVELALYAAGCGVMNLEFAFGHDEYAYLWALHNKVALPPEGLAMLRLHSCYPWHTGKAYRELMAPGDEALEAAVIDFNRFDLYTKADSLPDFDAVWPYWQGVVDEIAPGELDW